MTARNRSRSSLARVLRLAVITVVMTVPLAARAQSDAQKKEATEHYEKATRLYDVGKYADAIEEYQKVYLLVDDPNMLYNIGQCYRLADRPEEALRFYRNFLRRSPNAPRRADVEKKIDDLEKVIEERKRATSPVTPAAPPATVPAPVEAAPAAGPPPPPPPPIQPAPVTTPANAPAAVSTTVPPPATPAARPSRVPAYALLVAGGVFLATSIAAGAVAAQKAKDLEQLASDHKPFDANIQKVGKSASSAAVVTGLLGVVAGGLGGYLLYRSSGSSGESTQVSLFPIAAPQVAGGGARVTF